MMETTKTVQGLATEARSYFVTLTRDNGDVVWVTKDGRPDWVQDMSFSAHGGMLPDDWRYSFIVEALDALSEQEDPDDARSSIEADVYTWNLTSWLHSRVYRYQYCDDAAKEYGPTGDTAHGMIELLQWGQLFEKEEVFYQILGFLEKMVEEDN